MIHSMILGFKHLLKHNMFKTQGKAPEGGRGETNRDNYHRDSELSEFLTILYEKLALLHWGNADVSI